MGFLAVKKKKDLFGCFFWFDILWLTIFFLFFSPFDSFQESHSACPARAGR